MTLRSLLVRLAICVVILGLGLPMFAQYTDMAAVNELGGPAEFARRRAELAKQLKTGYLIMFARKTLPEAVHYREDNDFFYYTGLSDPGAVLVMDCAKGSSMIFEPQQAPRTKQVYGANLLSLAEEERKKLGFETVLPLDVLDRGLAYGLMRSESPELWARLTFADKADGARPETGGDYAEEYTHPYGDPLPGDRAAIKKLAERYPAAHLKDATPFIDAMRNIKTPQEIAVLRKNGALSAEGIKQGIAHAKAGMYEYQIEAQADFVFGMAGRRDGRIPRL